jgi:hypothetical protein
MVYMSMKRAANVGGNLFMSLASVICLPNVGKQKNEGQWDEISRKRNEAEVGAVLFAFIRYRREDTEVSDLHMSSDSQYRAI